jgi:peroxiredoxin Q/BCP
MKMHRLRKLWFGMLVGLSLAATSAYAIDAGQKAPEFSLPSSTGKEIKLADFAGKKNVVLFFFVGAFTNT